MTWTCLCSSCWWFVPRLEQVRNELSDALSPTALWCLHLILLFLHGSFIRTSLSNCTLVIKWGPLLPCGQQEQLRKCSPFPAKDCFPVPVCKHGITNVPRVSVHHRSAKSKIWNQLGKYQCFVFVPDCIPKASWGVQAACLHSQPFSGIYSVKAAACTE